MNIIVLSLLTSTVSAGEIQVSKRGHITNPVWSPDASMFIEVNEYAGNITYAVGKPHNHKDAQTIN